MNSDLAQILEAHGGLEHWRSLRRIDVEMSVSGFLFTSKRVPTMDHARLSFCTDKPEVSLLDYPRTGQVTTVFGEEIVEVRDAAGHLLKLRKHPRQFMRRLRRQLYWDELDFAYFCGYAMWNYLTMPFLLLRPGVEVSVQGTGPLGERQLDVTFPAGFPTHCRRQTFQFNAEGRLLRHDYTAEVVGSWATAAHLCSGYREFGGLMLPTRRRVHPMFFGKGPVRAVTLVAIDLHNVVPHQA